MAISKNLFSGGTLIIPGKIAANQRSTGRLLTTDLGKDSVLGWLFTLKTPEPRHVIMIKTNGGKITPGSIPGHEMFSPHSRTCSRSTRRHDRFHWQARVWITVDSTLRNRAGFGSSGPLNCQQSAPSANGSP
jgi:hypothetical protein